MTPLIRLSVYALAGMQIAACASLEDIAAKPQVSLRNVQVENLEMDRQTFLLSFDVTNPNSFKLPVNSIRYAVTLNGHNFASGSAACLLQIPAGSDSEVAITVDLDLLRTAPDLLFAARDADSRELAYALEGELGFDLPAVRPARFQESGVIRLTAARLP